MVERLGVRARTSRVIARILVVEKVGMRIFLFCTNEINLGRTELFQMKRERKGRVSLPSCSI